MLHKSGSLYDKYLMSLCAGCLIIWCAVIHVPVSKLLLYAVLLACLATAPYMVVLRRNISAITIKYSLYAAGIIVAVCGVMLLRRPPVVALTFISIYALIILCIADRYNSRALTALLGLLCIGVAVGDCLFYSMTRNLVMFLNLVPVVFYSAYRVDKSLWVKHGAPGDS